MNCTQITCDIGHLDADEFILIEVFSRLWLNTLIDDLGSGSEADISSLAFAQITSLPHVPKYTPPPQVIAVSILFHDEINTFLGNNRRKPHRYGLLWPGHSMVADLVGHSHRADHSGSNHSMLLEGRRSFAH